MTENNKAKERAQVILDHHYERIRFAKGLLMEYNHLGASETMQNRVIEEIVWRTIFSQDLEEIISQFPLSEDDDMGENPILQTV